MPIGFYSTALRLRLVGPVRVGVLWLQFAWTGEYQVKM